MWSQRIATEMGLRVERCIVEAERSGGDVGEVVGIVNRLFVAEPLGGAVEASLRTQCVSLTLTYLALLRPAGDWELVGHHVVFVGAETDLLWRHRTSGKQFIDEVKLPLVEWSDPKVRSQVTAQCEGAAAALGECFDGVRVCLPRAPAQTWMVTCRPNGRVGRRPFPQGLEPR